MMKSFARVLLSSFTLLVVSLTVTAATAQTNSADWNEVLAKAKGQTVYWNAWAGDEKTNAFIAWAGEQVKAKYGVTIQHVKLKDTAEAVTRVVAEKTAGKTSGGSVDLIWINGPNFLSMKEQGLLFGPFTQRMPNIALIDTTTKRSNVIDFTVPVDGMESPWRTAKIVFVYDSKRMKDAPPDSVAAMLAWAKKNPGKLTHPAVKNFLGSTFLKQALFELAVDPAVLQKPATDANFAEVTKPLWAWYDELRPNLWRKGSQFPENGPAQRQLMNDGEIDVLISFNPSEAAVSAQAGLLPESVRTFVFKRGTIGNTSFVAIPFNANAKEGAMVVANFLLEPVTQAHAQNVQNMGNFSVLDFSKLSAADKKRFDDLPKHPALLTNAELGPILLEPHPSWMTRITAEWERRYSGK
jgi:putative thiamine transport system substrate-binding protein